VIQPLLKYNPSDCTKASVRSVNMHRFLKFFLIISDIVIRSYAFLPLEVVDRKNFTEEFYHLKLWETPMGEGI